MRRFPLSLQLASSARSLVVSLVGGFVWTRSLTERDTLSMPVCSVRRES